MEATTTGTGAVAAERPLDTRYAEALCAYLARPDEIGLVRAHDLGREAIDRGLGVVAMTSMHAQAVAAAMRRTFAGEDRATKWELTERFAVEACSPFEMAHRGYWEANVALHRLNELLEGQARRIAAALHDEAGQLLAAVHFALADLALKVPPDRANDIRAVRDLLDQTEQRLRGIAHELRPPVLHQHGLLAALRFLAESTTRRWGLAIDVAGELTCDVPATVETTVYRIVQEALTNVGRHAHATTAQVDLRTTPRGLACAVRDDGVGFACTAEARGNGQAPGLGLLQIREQAAALGGDVRIGPHPPRGAELIVEIPLSRQRRR